MKWMMRSGFLLLLSLVFISMMQPRPTRIVFFGDSITAAGAQPGGYITLLRRELESKGLGSGYELTGSGIGGNKVYDLYLRMDSDVIARNPDEVFIWIGVNDVWHKATSGTGTDADKFEKFYAAIIKKLQEKNIRIVLCTPAAIGERTDYTNQQDGDLNHYSQIVRDLAKNYHCGLIDWREIFRNYSLKNNPENKESGILTTDRVHLNNNGNQLVADTILDYLVSEKK